MSENSKTHGPLLTYSYVEYNVKDLVNDLWDETNDMDEMINNTLSRKTDCSYISDENDSSHDYPLDTFSDHSEFDSLTCDVSKCMKS